MRALLMTAHDVNSSVLDIHTERTAESIARQAVELCDPRMLDEAIKRKGGRLNVLDHPITQWETGVSRRSGTLHAKAIKELFKACHTADGKGVGQGVQGAIANCRRLIELKAPVFLGEPGTGLEDDYTFAATKFVSMVWPDRYAGDLDKLFKEYVEAGDIKLEKPLGDEPRLVSHLLPLDAAIRVGNAHAAAAVVRAGARIEGVATDDMGRSMDLLAYASKRAQLYSAQVVAALKGALMERALLDVRPAANESTVTPARRRASL